MEFELNEKVIVNLRQHGYFSPILCGRGSFATVYRVTDEKGNFWACKISETTKMWQREYQNWAEIDHPVFPRYREHWTHGKFGYLVIEFLEGMDLHEMLERRGRLSPGRAAAVMGQIAEGLQYLHERTQPFLYRDLKPENIRIRVDGSVGIVDLGCLWNREQGWSAAGNYAYSAPEQFRTGEYPGEESDVYAAGKLLAALLGIVIEDNGQLCKGRIFLKKIFGKQLPESVIYRTRDRKTDGIGGTGHDKRKEYRGRRKERKQEKWLCRLIRMTACEERRNRIPDMKTLQRLLAVTDAPGWKKRQTLKSADFYYIRKIQYL